MDRSAPDPIHDPHNRGFRISAFCGELQKAEFERNVIRKRTLAGLKAARARGRVGGRPEKLSVRDKQQIRAVAQRPRSSRQRRGAPLRSQRRQVYKRGAGLTSLFFDTN